MKSYYASTIYITILKDLISADDHASKNISCIARTSFTQIRGPDKNYRIENIANPNPRWELCFLKT